jgi:hypothetical protein
MTLSGVFTLLGNLCLSVVEYATLQGQWVIFVGGEIDNELILIEVIMGGTGYISL